MTELRRVVRRRTAGTYDHRGKRIVVFLEPGDVIAMREEGCRTTFYAPINRVFRQMMVWTADAKRAERKAKRKGKGVGR